MNKFKILLSAISLIALTSFLSPPLPSAFSSLLTRTKLEFTMPQKFKETLCIENNQMNYEFAIIHQEEKFEIRYAIRPMDSLIINHDSAKKRGEISVHPNNFSRFAYQATLLNIGLGGAESGKIPYISYFDSTAVKKEFNADWGATALSSVGPEFGGTEYKYCLSVLIHKDFIGDAYFFYLSDDKNVIDKLLLTGFHSLKFK